METGEGVITVHGQQAYRTFRSLRLTGIKARDPLQSKRMRQHKVVHRPETGRTSVDSLASRKHRRQLVRRSQALSHGATAFGSIVSISSPTTLSVGAVSEGNENGKETRLFRGLLIARFATASF